jgi:hypothetical protein
VRGCAHIQLDRALNPVVPLLGLTPSLLPKPVDSKTKQRKKTNDFI